MSAVRIRGLLLLLALWPVWVHAMSGVFYQPQLRDRAVAVAWPEVFAGLRREGFDTLILQWTEYGEAFADDAGRNWLGDRIREARASGLDVVLGLAADSGTHAGLKSAGPFLPGSFAEILARNGQSASRWVASLGPQQIAAWYLPFEIDDLKWRQADALAQLQRYLAEQVRQLQRIHHRPVYVTTYFTGSMEPEHYASMLRTLHATGVRLWVQDGAGTARLNAAERKLYLDAVTRCPGSAAHGMVFEVFRQTAHDGDFRAEPLSADADGAAAKRRAPCNGAAVVFSLRYLPAGRQLPR